MPSSGYRVTQDLESYFVPCWPSSVIQKVSPNGSGEHRWLSSHLIEIMAAVSKTASGVIWAAPGLWAPAVLDFTAARVAKAWIVGSSRYSSACVWALALDREEEDRATYICCVLILDFFPEIYTCPQDLAVHVVPVHCWSNRCRLEHRSTLLWPTPNHSVHSFSLGVSWT